MNIKNEKKNMKYYTTMIDNTGVRNINITEKSKIIKPEQYRFFYKNSYKLGELKEICKYYKLKLSGKKIELIDRIYICLKKNNYVIKIQRMVRRFIILKYNRLKGPGLITRNRCINDSDFFSMESMKDISYANFFSFKGHDNNIWGFDTISLYTLFLKNNNEVINPYNREKLNNNILQNIITVNRLSKILKLEVTMELEDNLIELSEKKKTELRILDVFMKIDELGNYTNKDWFYKLNKNQLIRFIRELLDIWSYRAQLTNAVKKQICPPYGNIINININNLDIFDYNRLQKIGIDIIEKMVKSGVNTDSKSIGAYYVLTALTLVNKEAAISMPWLYESVVNIY